MHDDRFGLAKLPRGISGIGSDQRGDIVPERHVSVTPLGGAVEALALSPRHVIADQVQRRDGHTGRLHRPTRDPLAVHEGEVLPTRGSGSPDRYSTASEDVAVLSPRNTDSSSRSPRPSSPSYPKRSVTVTNVRLPDSPRRRSKCHTAGSAAQRLDGICRAASQQRPGQVSGFSITAVTAFDAASGLVTVMLLPSAGRPPPHRQRDRQHLNAGVGKSGGARQRTGDDHDQGYPSACGQTAVDDRAHQPPAPAAVSCPTMISVRRNRFRSGTACGRQRGSGRHPRSPRCSAWTRSSAEGDDWLTVNVWSPDVSGGLPVLVWIQAAPTRSACPVYPSTTAATSHAAASWW